ncbi:MAG: DNA cytosine methyltransferase [Cypionkella sp.]
MGAANDNAVGTTADEPITFFSVCSGIEAASVAWTPLGWQCVGVSEIEKFPSGVLAHHYPDVKNHGDFTTVDVRSLPRVDILCGGTPCQAFSVAGLRRSLDDVRGNLSLSFVRLAHELADNNGLRNAVWENVPGVLSTKDNAFGCFLGALVGADDAVPPPAGRRWPDQGMVSGPKGRAAWAILDAQYFGLAQRRKRVILVADFGTGADPAAVLLEFHGLSRNPPSRGEAGKDIAPTISARTKGGGGLGTDFDLDGGLVESAVWPADLASTLNAAFGSKLGLENQHINSGAPLFVPSVHAIQAGALRTNPASGPDGVGVQEGISYTLEARSEVQAVVYSIMPQNSGKDFKARIVDVAQPIMAGGPVSGNQGGDVIVEPVAYRIAGDGAAYNEGDCAAPLTTGTDPNASVVAFDTTQITSAANRSNPKAGDPCHPLSAQAHPPAITVALRGREGGGTAELGGEVATALRASTGGGDKPHVLTSVGTDVFNGNLTGDVAATMGTRGSSSNASGPTVLTSAVRRLTPTECERLQGFPDGYTDIPWRGKPTSPNGPRYKALGNSWAVPKFTWLGRRIQKLMPKREALRNAA